MPCVVFEIESAEAIGDTARLRDFGLAHAVGIPFDGAVSQLNAGRQRPVTAAEPALHVAVILRLRCDGSGRSSAEKIEPRPHRGNIEKVGFIAVSVAPRMLSLRLLDQTGACRSRKLTRGVE